MVKSIQRYRYKHACHITPSAAENKNSRQSFFSFFLIYPMIRGGVHVEGIRAREVLLLPQTLKNRRQLAHKLLRYTINEKFRNTPVLLLRDYRFFFYVFSFFFFLSTIERTYEAFDPPDTLDRKLHQRSLLLSITSITKSEIDDGYDLSSRRIRKIRSYDDK